MNRPLSILLFLLASASSVRAAAIDFSHQIVPVLRQYCGECHAGDKKKGGFSINTRESLLGGGESGKAATPGRSRESELLIRATTQDESLRMPPKGARVPADKIALLRNWIDGGVSWDEGFTFAGRDYEPPLKPRRPQLPAVVGGRINPIDRIVDAYRLKNRLPPPAPLDDASFYRRASLDVVGLLPDPKAVAEFVQEKKAEKRAALVKRLLASDAAYAEHWLTFWNDLLRNDYDGTGFITGGRKQITSWLYKALLSNKPYDQFVRELVAPAAEAEGFINGIRWRGDVNASQTQDVQFAQNVSQAFLGVNLKCASCHDSFIDRWKLHEAYGMASITANAPLDVYRCDKPTGGKATAAWLFPELGKVDPDAPRAARLRQLASLMTHPENGRLTRTIVNRLWHRLMGRGIVHPVDAMHTQPWNADLLDFLAVHLADECFDLKKTLELILTSQAYQSKTTAVGKPTGEAFIFTGPLAKRMTAEQFLDAVWQVTGAGPSKIDAPIARPKNVALPTRAALVKSDLLMRALGRPNRDQIVSMRPEDLTTLEAIDLANHQILADVLERGAKNLLARRWASSDALVEWIYQFALCRRPTVEESALARSLLGAKLQEQGVQDLLWAVFMLPEFQLIR